MTYPGYSLGMFHNNVAGYYFSPQLLQEVYQILVLLLISEIGRYVIRGVISLFKTRFSASAKVGKGTPQEACLLAWASEHDIMWVGVLSTVFNPLMSSPVVLNTTVPFPGKTQVMNMP